MADTAALIMADAAKPIYLVDAYHDPVIIRIDGRASFQNTTCLHDFFAETQRQGKNRYVIDFQHCTSMDSTFLGVLAGAALQLRKSAPPGKIVCARVGERNLELIRNLGLHRLVTVDSGNFPMNFNEQCVPLRDCDHSEVENARLVLEAHENLVTTDESNRNKFQDVLAFLRNRVGQK